MQYIINSFYIISYIIISSLVILTLLVNNLLILMCLFLFIIFILTLILLYSSLQFVAYIFLIVYGGGLIVLYFIVIQFNNLLNYTIILNRYKNKIWIILFNILFISILVMYFKKFNLYTSNSNNHIFRTNFNHTYDIYSKFEYNISNTFNTHQILYNFTYINGFVLILIGLMLVWTIYISINLLKLTYK